MPHKPQDASMDEWSEAEAESIRSLMGYLAKRRWAKATPKDRAKQGQAMLKGRKKALRKRLAEARRAKRESKP